MRELLHEAKLDQIFSKEPVWGGADKRAYQNQLLTEAAQAFELYKGHNVSEWFATSIEEYKILKKRIEANQTGWKRPHGLYIDTFSRIENKGLYLKKDSPEAFVVIKGEFTVFAEKEPDTRPPYLVICLLGYATKESKRVEILKAYAHPCMAWDRLLLVDSNNERRTLGILTDCRDKLASTHDTALTIIKPLFDMSPDDTKDATKPCLPDFILHCRGLNIKHQVIIVETMGYDTAKYLERKQRMHPIFRQIGKGSALLPLIEHDCTKQGTLRDEADRFFRQQVMESIFQN